MRDLDPTNPDTSETDAALKAAVAAMNDPGIRDPLQRAFFEAIRRDDAPALEALFVEHPELASAEALADWLLDEPGGDRRAAIVLEEDEPFQRTALGVAAERGALACLAALLRRADPNAPAGEEGQTALMLAAHQGRLGAVQMLLAHGANPNAQNRLDRIALTEAAIENHVECVQLLLAATELDTRTPEGARAVDSVADAMPLLLFFGRVDVVQLLLPAVKKIPAARLDSIIAERHEEVERMERGCAELAALAAPLRHCLTLLETVQEAQAIASAVEGASERGDEAPPQTAAAIDAPAPRSGRRL
jgi:hypothetical protein